MERVTTVALGVTEHGPAFAAWVDHGGDVDNEAGFEEAFVGSWDSAEDYADSLLDDFGLEAVLDQAVPQALRAYVTIDSEGFARDLELGGDITVVANPDGGVWVFDGHR
jgi:antirestriction protein